MKPQIDNDNCVEGDDQAGEENAQKTKNHDASTSSGIGEDDVDIKEQPAEEDGSTESRSQEDRQGADYEIGYMSMKLQGLKVDSDDDDIWV
jgi:hypothetical protein